MPVPRLGASQPIWKRTTIRSLRFDLDIGHWQCFVKFLSAKKPPWAPQQHVGAHFENAGARYLSLVKIRITKAQIEALVSKGYLDRESCDDLTAMEAAAEAWLIDALARPSDAVTINHPAARRSRPKGTGAQ